ncbi:DNA translocase FtsK [Caviibacter abscessus]|uniref:DNA translocase FtsK n=1 Tax=Caviibacter abscessus TaxID=1766719 RepID=UPI0009E99A5E|nr:DNA translocase FtsK [Caviibacter abscessus]
MKKSNTKSENRIKKSETNLFIRKIKGIGIIATAVDIILVGILKTNLEINKGILNTALLFIFNILHLIFGDIMIYAFSFWLIIYGKTVFTGEKFKIKRIIYFVSLFILTSLYITMNTLPTIEGSNIINAGQKILKFGFEHNGAGLFGSILTIPLYSLVGNSVFSYINLFLIISLLFIYFKARVIVIYSMFKTTMNYYNSEEYKQKMKILKAKREIELQEEKKIEKLKEEEFKNVFITLAKDKLDKEIAKKPKTSIFNKSEYYDDEELEKKQKQWLEYYEKQKTETIETNETTKDINIENKEKSIEIFPKPSIEKEQEQIDDYLVEPQNTEDKFEKIEEQKTFEIEDRKALQQSIDEVFVYKKMDESKKSVMIKQIKENISKLEQVLKDYGVDARVVDYVTGPTITRYEIKIPAGVRVNKVTQLSDEISMYLSAKSIRFEAPIPGKDTIGIETPNETKEPVYFANLLHSKELENGDLSVILGKDIIGKERIIDIAKMPHLLIAGQTGSGKSVAINTILSTLISKKTEEEVKFILVDPKMVELMPYNGIPHLLVPVIIDPTQAAIALKWAVTEMEERYKKLANLGVRNIKSYNEYMKTDKMPYIVIIIDELADLMMVSANSVEISIARIAQKARAVGIHLIVATQRPSTDVITGMIKANLPSRISFALRTQIDSRTILDQAGAEKLLGQGDMLLLENGKSKLDRIQGAYISDEEITNLTMVLKKNRPAKYNMEILEPPQEDMNNLDPYYEKAVNLVRQCDDRISISMLQRELQIGFNRASRICKDLKDNGIIDDNNQIIND